MSLWKISITISPEAEEAAAQLLEEISGEPVSVYVDAQTQRIVATVYLPKAADWSAEKQAALRAGLQRIKAAGLIIGPGRTSVTKIRREDWAESWKRHFKPIEIGRALLLKPSWSRRPPKKHQVVVILDPGLSFGTGQHPTTRFCLEQLVAVRKQGSVQSFLDIGTGSGILAIAAAKLGYAPVRALDFDPEAVRIARANAKQNGVQEKVQLACQDLARLPSSRGRQYDLVCANLVFDLLLAERKRILARLKPSATLVLAGILRAQFSQVRESYEASGLRLASFKAKKEWASGAFISANPVPGG